MEKANRLNHCLQTHPFINKTVSEWLTYDRFTTGSLPCSRVCFGSFWLAAEIMWQGGLTKRYFVIAGLEMISLAALFNNLGKTGFLFM